MYPHQDQKQFIDEIKRIDISLYISAFIVNVRKMEGRVFDLRHFNDVRYMKELLNTPKYNTFKSTKDTDGVYYWSSQKIDFIPSNLGQDRGYVFYFICNWCGRRAKYLYELNPQNALLCRKCCRLRYHTPKKKMQTISRLIRRPYLSSENKHYLVRIAGITHDDIPDELEYTDFQAPPQLCPES